MWQTWIRALYFLRKACYSDFICGNGSKDIKDIVVLNSIMYAVVHLRRMNEKEY